MSRLFYLHKILATVRNGPTAFLTRDNHQWPLPACRSLIIDESNLKYTSRFPLTLQNVIFSSKCDADTHYHLRNLGHLPHVRNLVYLSSPARESFPILKNNKNLTVYVPSSLFPKCHMSIYSCELGSPFHWELNRYIEDHRH